MSFQAKKCQVYLEGCFGILGLVQKGDDFLKCFSMFQKLSTL